MKSKEIVKLPPKYSSRIEIINTSNIEFKKNRLRQKILAETEENLEAETSLMKIDFAMLRIIIIDRLREICPELIEENVNVLTPDKIKFKKQLGVSFTPGEPARYDPLSNLITIEYNQLKRIYGDAAARALQYVCFHEEIHAISKNVCEYGTYENNILQNGYRYMGIYDSYPLVSFDEAVTEKMTREIITEYEKRKGTPILDGLKLAYEKLVSFLDLLIQKISEKTGIHESVIWKKIQREKIIGKENGVESVMDRLEQIFSSEFVNKIIENDIVGAITEINNDNPNTANKTK